jgi:NADPH:quinone reductase-like Zn-dependent oxidoreductase
VNARVARGHHVLITGIGGGVALLAMQLCLAIGARVYVTSGSDAKLARAVALGAAGGANYTHGQYYSTSPVHFHLHSAPSGRARSVIRF